MGITTLSMMLTVLILNLHHITDRPVPRWVRKLVLSWLACLGPKQQQQQLQQQQLQLQPLGQEQTLLMGDKRTKSRSSQRRARLFYHRSSNDVINGVGGVNRAVLEIRNQHARDDAADDDDVTGSGGGANETTPLNHHNHHHYQAGGAYDVTERRHRTDSSCSDKSRSAEYAQEWTRVAQILDRLFFTFFLLAIIVTTLALFHPLVTGVGSPLRTSD